MMNLWRVGLRSADRWLAKQLQPRWLPIADGPPIVSVTFDDVIASACDVGADLLETYGGRGTYYVAGGLTASVEQSKLTHTVEQLRRLSQAGHELGCHTWSHRHCSTMSKEQLQAEFERNANFLSELQDGAQPLAIRSFAYPFGDFSHESQRVCIQRFSSCRVLGDGVHRGHADLNRLGSMRLYGSGIHDWREGLDQIANGGWLVLNTHGVDADPGQYGCAPAHLRELLTQAQKAGCDILPVSAVVRRFDPALA